MDEDDLKWVASEKKIVLLLKQIHKNARSKTPRCRKFEMMQVDDLMHREGLKG